MSDKKAAYSTRRLRLGLIVCLLVLIAVSVAGGVAFSGVLWYQEQVSALQKANEETVSGLQQRLQELEQELREAQQQGEEASSEARELRRQLEELRQQLQTAQEELEAAKAAAGSMAAVVPTYPPGAKLVALTFDDGPGKNTTPRLLDELKKRQAKATFFVVGTNAERYPDILKRMDAEGHVIGSHTWSHKNLTKVSKAELEDQLQRCSDAIEKAVGHGPALLRPPGGSYDNRLLAYCREIGLPLANWSVDTRDWQTRSSSAVLAAAFQEGKYGIRDGAIVLMHDVYESTVDAAVEIMDRLTQEGYIMVTVPELLQARAGGAQAGRMYFSESYFKDAA